MSQHSQESIQRVAAMQKGKHRFPPRANLFDGTLNPLIAARRQESLLEDIDRLLWLSSVLIHLSQVQVQLSMIVPQSKRFQAERRAVSKALLGDCHQ